ncbi:MAG: hypothetical protein J7M25_11600 [Deltaproteobacteria bacterium]|nr:hypothetical protein [Deltaproteobacteria bacterium]
MTTRQLKLVFVGWEGKNLWADATARGWTSLLHGAPVGIKVVGRGPTIDPSISSQGAWASASISGDPHGSSPNMASISEVWDKTAASVLLVRPGTPPPNGAFLGSLLSGLLDLSLPDGRAPGSVRQWAQMAVTAMKSRGLALGSTVTAREVPSWPAWLQHLVVGGSQPDTVWSSTNRDDRGSSAGQTGAGWLDPSWACRPADPGAVGAFASMHGFDVDGYTALAPGRLDAHNPAFPVALARVADYLTAERGLPCILLGSDAAEVCSCASVARSSRIRHDVFGPMDLDAPMSMALVRHAQLLVGPASWARSWALRLAVPTVPMTQTDPGWIWPDSLEPLAEAPKPNEAPWWTALDRLFDDWRIRTDLLAAMETSCLLGLDELARLVSWVRSRLDVPNDAPFRALLPAFVADP